MQLIYLSEGRLYHGTLYPALRDMERDGLVTHVETTPIPEQGNRPRYLYEITRAGRDELAAVEAMGEGMTTP